MKYWCINNKEIPKWIQDLINRGLLKNIGPTSVSDCWEFKSTPVTTSPTYLYDGDGLMLSKNKIGIVFDCYKDFEELKEDIPVRKIICDMCGEEIKSESEVYLFKLYKQDDYIQNTNEICEQCFNKIKDFTKLKIS